jgi:hypothetical protein
LTLFGLLTLFLPKSQPRLKITAVGTFLLIDLVIAGYGLNPFTSPSVFEGDVLKSSVMNLDGRLYMPSALEQRLKFDETHRFNTFHPGFDWELVRELAIPNTPLLEGIASANNFDPMVPERYLRLLEMIETLDPGNRDRLLGWMGVTQRVAADPEDSLAVELIPVESSGKFHIASEAVLVDSGEEALERLAQASIDFRDQVILEGVVPLDIEIGDTGTVIEASEVGPGDTRVMVNATEGAWLVVADTWYPGWQAELDGEAVEIYKANYLFQAVYVPPGEHTVHFIYRPASFYLGLVLSGIGLLVVATLGLVWMRRR